MRGRLASAVAALVGTGLAHTLSAAPPMPALTRVRPVNPQARELILDAWRSSATVRTLIDTLEASDLIVQIEEQRVPAILRSRTRFMSATPECRYLRVSIRVPDLRERLVPALAHELQHAVEIAQAKEVRDEQGARDLLARIGWEWRPAVFETEAALAIEDRVRHEVAHRR